MEQDKSNEQMSFTGHLDLSAQETELYFADGTVVSVPTAWMQQAQARSKPVPATSDNVLVIPLVEEQLQVDKRVVETGRVLLNKTVETYDVTFDENLAANTWQIERVPKNDVVHQAPATRHEGETTVYPIVEERLVLTKELVLVEEVRVTRQLSERRHSETVTLRREKMSAEHSATETV